jgi:hypothetical protein
MKTLIKKTKKNTYINYDGTIFQVIKSANGVEFTQVSPEVIQERGLLHPSNWADYGEQLDIESAYYEHIRLNLEARKVKQEQSILLQIEQLDKWNNLKKLDVIPSTLDNIRLLLIHLNKSNWGSWTLPKMTIGYSVHQYDCDGSNAVTIKLDKAIDGCKLYKIGGKFGHLTNYQSL